MNSLGRSAQRKGTPKNFCDKDFAELSRELSGAICLKILVWLGSALELFRKFFAAVRAIFWLWGSFSALGPNLCLFLSGVVVPHLPCEIFRAISHPFSAIFPASSWTI